MYICKTTEKFKEFTSKDVSKYQNSIKSHLKKRDAQDKHVVSDNMPCLCQYFATEIGLRVKASLDVKDNIASHEEGNVSEEEVKTGEVTASELAVCRTEINSLNKELSSYKISNENMEILMTKMVEKQHFLMTEILELKKINEDLRLQQVKDRNNQALERGVLLRELHGIKTHLRFRSGLMEKFLKQNQVLTAALKEANEKIYAMGMKYLKLKSFRTLPRDGITNNNNRGVEMDRNSFNSELSENSLSSNLSC